MKKAVIQFGNSQYMVSKGDVIDIDLVDTETKINPTVLLVIEDGKTLVGSPYVDSVKVTTKILEQEVKTDKVLAIRYKAKKRVRKVRGHRQRFTRIQISDIK